LHLHSHWPTHAPAGGTAAIAGHDVQHPLDARRCTVQLSNGRLYLDAVASPETSLLGHDFPALPAPDAASMQGVLSTLVPGFVCLGMSRSFSAAAELAVQLATAAVGTSGKVVAVNALDGEPEARGDFLVAHENETLGRTGRWLASAGWRRVPEMAVIGEALALGAPFGAVLGRGGIFAESHAAPEALARVAAAVAAVEYEGLLQQGGEVAQYLQARLASVRESSPGIERVESAGLSFRITLVEPLKAAPIRRKMCERGVLAGVDETGRLAIEPPLALRIAEADVITGALRGALLDLPMVSASPCCSACEIEV
jgi:4-aminobutyrate aminotransferase-like enzyme